MLSVPFYHSLFKKYVIIFGTLFNNIRLDRIDENGNKTTIRVPIAYGPRDRFIARVEDNPEAIAKYSSILPRIGFEIKSLRYASNRKLATTGRKATLNNINGNNVYKKVYNPVPYDIHFTLSVLTKTTEDGTKIVEQILPYFTPEWTVSAKLLDDFDDITDIPVVLTDVSVQDNYNADFTARRAIVYNMEFVMKTYFYGPVTQAKIIKVAEVSTYAPLDATDRSSSTTVQPGMTANGTPTSDINQSVSYSLIDETDNYGYIITYEDFPDA